MSNDKLQASDIAGFSAHGLKVNTPKGILTVHELHFIDKYKIWCKMNPLSKRKDVLENSKNYIGEYPLGKGFRISKVKPILFSPEVLTQTITFRGKQVCHLIELAKIAFPNIKGWFIEDDIVIPIGFNFSFSYNEENKSFESFDYDFEKDEKIPFTTPNQAALFAYLNWALVDYMGLGERGLCEYLDLENNNVYAK